MQESFPHFKGCYSTMNYTLYTYLPYHPGQQQNKNNSSFQQLKRQSVSILPSNYNTQDEKQQQKVDGEVLYVVVDTLYVSTETIVV